MDALMAALVAALLIRATDRSSLYVALAAERSGRTGAVLIAIALALIVTQTVAAIGGAVIAPYLTPNARRLFLSFALLSAGLSAFWPVKPVTVGAMPRPLIAATARLIATGLGDRTQFATLAVAVGGAAGLAGAGGFIGGAVVLGAAALAGEQVWRAMPQRAIRYAVGGVLTVAGAWLAVSALRLI